MNHSNLHTKMIISFFFNQSKHISSKSLVAQWVHPFTPIQKGPPKLPIRPPCRLCHLCTAYICRVILSLRFQLSYSAKHHNYACFQSVGFDHFDTFMHCQKVKLHQKSLSEDTSLCFHFKSDCMHLQTFLRYDSYANSSCIA